MLEPEYASESKLLPSEKKDYFICKTFYTNLMVTTQQKSRVKT